MPSYNELKNMLLSEEPNYQGIVYSIGQDELNHLDDIIKNEAPSLGAKAASVAGLMTGAGAIELLESAMASPHEVVRIAAAAYLSSKPTGLVSGALLTALGDPSDQVRFVVLDRWQSTTLPSEEIMETLVKIWGEDSQEYVRESAYKLLGLFRRLNHYCANKNTREVHRISALTSRCQLDKIKRFRPYSTIQAAHNDGYDNCAYCIGDSMR